MDLRCGDVNDSRWQFSSDYFYDLELTWEHDAEKKEWTLRIKANGENAGFQFLGEKLYNAPADGYVKEGDFKISYFGYFDKPPVRHVYLRLRDPGMYARLDITSSRANENALDVKGEAFINPFGDRCLEALEFDDDHYDYYLDLEKKTERAMKEQRLLPKPDFEKWIKEGKAKY